MLRPGTRPHTLVKLLSYPTQPGFGCCLLMSHFCTSSYNLMSPRGYFVLFLSLAAPNVFSFPVFSPPFCQQLLEELDHFEHSNIPKGRPNTMNKSGVSASSRTVGDTTTIDHTPQAELNEALDSIPREWLI